MGNEPMDEIMTTSPSQLMRRAVQAERARIRQHLEAEIAKTEDCADCQSALVDMLAFVTEREASQ